MIFCFVSFFIIDIIVLNTKETNKIIAEFATQKEAQEAIGKEGKSGISDALNGRTKTHKAYGYVWYFKNEYQGK